MSATRSQKDEEKKGVSTISNKVCIGRNVTIAGNILVENNGFIAAN